MFEKSAPLQSKNIHAELNKSSELVQLLLFKRYSSNKEETAMLPWAKTHIEGKDKRKNSTNKFQGNEMKIQASHKHTTQHMTSHHAMWKEQASEVWEKSSLKRKFQLSSLPAS